MIRSHGVTRREQEELIADGLRVVDATCPFVKKIHTLVQEYSENGYYVVIIGSGDHPEVQGIVGWSDETRTSVICDPIRLRNLELKPWKRSVLSHKQHLITINFKNLLKLFKKKGMIVRVRWTRIKNLLFTIRYAMPPRNVRKQQESFPAEWMQCW